MEINFDPTALAAALVNALTTSLGNFFDKLPTHVAENLNDSTQRIWEDIWDSEANLLVPPMSLTVDYGPVQQLMHWGIPAVYGIVFLAFVLLGIRSLFSSFAPQQASVVNEFIYGILLGCVLAGTTIIMLHKLWQMVTVASDLVGRTTFSGPAITRGFFDVGYDPIIGLIIFVVVLINLIMLAVKLGKRIVALGVLTVCMPVASCMWVIPQTRWVTKRFWSAYVGLLFGGILATMCISLGLQLAVAGTGIAKIIYALALMSLAGDMLVFLGGGGLVGGGLGFLGGLTLGAGGAALAAGTGGAAGAAAGAASSVGNMTAGALPAPRYGVD